MLTKAIFVMSGPRIPIMRRGRIVITRGRGYFLKKRTIMVMWVGYS